MGFPYAVVAVTVCLLAHELQPTVCTSADPERAPKYGKSKHAKSGLPYLAAASPTISKKIDRSSAGSSPGPGRSITGRGIAPSATNPMGIVQPTTDDETPFEPPTDASGFLLHGLPALRGLPNRFDANRCNKFSNSMEYMQHTRHVEDLLNMGNHTLYWTFIYALECTLVVAPPSPEAILLRVDLLKRIGDERAAFATLRYARRVAPASPAVKWALAEAIGSYLHTSRRGSSAKAEHAEMMTLYRALASQKCYSAQTCFELSKVHLHMGNRSSALNNLEQAVEMNPDQAGYASKLWASCLETSVEQIRKVRDLFSQQSRNYLLWTQATRRKPLVPVEEWLAGYPGAREASAYATATLLGPAYHPDSPALSPTISAVVNTTSLWHIATEAGGRYVEAKRALEELLATEQPEVCQRIDRLCSEGPTRLLYSLTSPKTATVHTQLGMDASGKSTIDFAAITKDSLGVRGTPFGTPWQSEPWPMFPMYMVNMLRSICGCTDLNCSLAGYVWLMDPDAIRQSIEAAREIRATVNNADELGYTPPGLAIINNDPIAFAALLDSGVVDFSTQDAWGHSVVQLLYMVTPTTAVQAMHEATDLYLQARGGPGLPPLLVGTPRQLPKVPGLDVAEGWDPTSRTLPWSPLANWTGSSVVDDVDATTVSMADIVDKYVTVGRPVVIKGALRNCVNELRQWSKESMRNSALANTTYKAYSGESSIMTTFRGFIDNFMSTGELTNTSQPRYILAQKAAKVMELELKTMTKVHFLTDLMQCIPYELQEYFNLVPPQLAGAWSQYTLSMGGAGAGASFHMHEAAINVVVYGTRKWYVYPPTHASYTNMPMFHWVRDVLPTLPPEQRPIEFIQESGDIVFLPSWWAHGTVSVGDTLGFFKVINNKLVDTKNPTGPLKEVVEPPHSQRKKWASRTREWPLLASSNNH